MYDNKNIPKNIITIYNIYIMNILKYKMFVQMAESDIIRFTKQQETKNFCWDCLWKTKQKHGFTTWTTWNQNVRVNSANLTNMKKKNKLHI